MLALFILLPIVELVLLIQVGQWIGLGWTLALVLVTGFVGAALARRQGLRAWLAIQGEIRQGRMPGGTLVDGLMILIGGVVLLTPGLLTDLLGFALLIPWTRNVLKRGAQRRLERAVQQGDANITIMLR